MQILVSWVVDYNCNIRFWYHYGNKYFSLCNFLGVLLTLNKMIMIIVIKKS